jgi:hypothetical protein
MGRLRRTFWGSASLTVPSSVVAWISQTRGLPRVTDREASDTGVMRQRFSVAGATARTGDTEPDAQPGRQR